MTEKTLGALCEMVIKREPQAMARALFDELERLGPLDVPPRPPFGNEEALRKWQRGEHVDDITLQSIPMWVRANKMRRNAIEGNRVRLRCVLWMHDRLEDDFKAQLSDFLRDCWQITEWPADFQGREEFVSEQSSLSR